MRKRIIQIAVMALVAAGMYAGSAFHQGGPVLLASHDFLWTDPASGGQVMMMERVYEGCVDEAGVFNPHDMTWAYVVDNLSYDPHPGATNGFSGFQILFPGPVPELYNQQSPAIGGPWLQNTFSGQFPPFGVEWDAPLPGLGIMPGQTGTFSFCTWERRDVVVKSEGEGGGPAGWAHTWGLLVPEPIIDADGTLSPARGVPAFVEVTIGDPLTSWPDVPPVQGTEGLDWFDNDGSCTWTFGDDLHVEGVAYPGANRNAFHDQNPIFFDPIVLDLDGSFFDGQQVDVDLETGTSFTGCPGPDPVLKYFNTNGVTNWDDGEDIVLDLNLDSVFGTVDNIQTYIFHGYQSVPGELLNTLGMACSEDDQVCKKVKYLDEDRDGIIEVGEPVWFLEVIQVHNPSSMNWMNTTVKDRWGAEIDVTAATPSMGTATLTTKGKSVKEFLAWNVGTLAPGHTANLVLRAMTDLNPGGHQSYSSCGRYEYNSGAVLKFLVDDEQYSFETGSIWLEVPCG